MTRTVEFPEGLLVHIEDPNPNLNVRRKPWGNVPAADGERPLRALLNFEIYDCADGKPVGGAIRVTLIARYLPSDVERAGQDPPRLLLWNGSSWDPPVAFAGEGFEYEANQVHPGFGGYIIARNVMISDPPAALG